MFVRRVAVLCAHLVTTASIVILLYKFFPTFSCFYSNSANLILYAFVAFFTYSLSRRYFLAGKIQPKDKAVFVTGCDTGFGNGLAKRLDSKGFRVFAGCLFPDGPGAEELKSTCSDNLRVLYLDITKDESVEKALNFVKQNLGTSDLWAIVNNAGIFKGSAIEITPIDVFKENMEVNSIGPVRVTKAFLPLLRKSKGRVVIVNSFVARNVLLAFGAYSMSKYASLGFTQCLSQEMSIWGVRVISVEPEMFRTSLSDSKRLTHAIDEGVTKISKEILTSYGEEYLDTLKLLLNRFVAFASSKTHLVVDDIESAIMDEYPKHVYKPRSNFITRTILYFVEIIPYALYEYILLTVYNILGNPIPKDVKENA